MTSGHCGRARAADETHASHGVGLAAAILIDATLIRVVLLPATMTVLGDANWYLPRFLHRAARSRQVAAPAHSAG